MLWRTNAKGHAGAHQSKLKQTKELNGKPPFEATKRHAHKKRRQVGGSAEQQQKLQQLSTSDLLICFFEAVSLGAFGEEKKNEGLYFAYGRKGRRSTISQKTMLASARRDRTDDLRGKIKKGNAVSGFSTRNANSAAAHEYGM